MVSSEKIDLATGVMLTIQPCCISGSGKTSLLMALLGEMHFVRNHGSSFSLPRSGGVSYADQGSWLQNQVN